MRVWRRGFPNRILGVRGGTPPGQLHVALNVFFLSSVVLCASVSSSDQCSEECHSLSTRLEKDLSGQCGGPETQDIEENCLSQLQGVHISCCPLLSLEFWQVSPLGPPKLWWPGGWSNGPVPFATAPPRPRLPFLWSLESATQPAKSRTPARRGQNGVLWLYISAPFGENPVVTGDMMLTPSLPLSQGNPLIHALGNLSMCGGGEKQE